MNYGKGYIELTYEIGYKKPIQARFYKRYFGKIKVFHFFAEWNTFDEAIEWLSYKHNQYKIVVKKQLEINF